MKINLRKLSESTDGKAIKVAATGTPGTATHTAIAGTTAGAYDKVWLWAYNADVTDRVLTIEFGGVSDPDDLIVKTLPAQSGLVLVCPGLTLQNAKAVAAFCDVTNVVMVTGYIERSIDT